MQIVFDKVGTTAKPVEVTLNGVNLIGTVKKSGYHQVTLESKLSGNLVLTCDRCGQAYNYPIENQLRLKLSDLVSEDKDDLDIIEFLDGKIDILYILQSEITSIESSYQYCSTCDESDEIFEVEY